jgi:2,3,4,5-tetrahydropyridine-2-carboxylate N-succinyltransferase
LSPGRARERPAAGDRVAGFAAARTPTEPRREAFFLLQRALGQGEVRAAEPDAGAPSGWRVNGWVQQASCSGSVSATQSISPRDHGKWPFMTRTRCGSASRLEAGIRIVPGGSTIRDGAFVHAP